MEFEEQPNIMIKYAGVAELADALDLGSGVNYVGVQVPSPAPNSKFLNKHLVLCCDTRRKSLIYKQFCVSKGVNNEYYF